MLVSRSFAAVIMELPAELREAVLVFYLVLRALDSVGMSQIEHSTSLRLFLTPSSRYKKEDDMAVDLNEKCCFVARFHKRPSLPEYSLKGYGEKAHERDLLENYTNVCRVYARLKPQYRAVIKDICARMGNWHGRVCAARRADARRLRALLVSLHGNRFCRCIPIITPSVV
jgi:farnesyl-diphosphate farnesyltransferase